METLNTTDPAIGSLLTAAELRARWKVCSMTIWRMRRDGKLPVRKLGERTIRFAMEDVKRIEQQAAA